MPITIADMTLYSIVELSKKFDVTPITLRSYLRSGKMKGQKIGQRWFVSKTNLKEYFDGPGQQAKGR